uniref:Growth arrest and DNA damage inducible alpha n=1 Tax=Junco hyemalis TaxID=40217 RepID=A0A8C5J2U0_JUNHY
MEGQHTGNGFQCQGAAMDGRLGIVPGRGWAGIPRFAVAAPGSRAVPKARLGGLGAGCSRAGSLSQLRSRTGPGPAGLGNFYGRGLICMSQWERCMQMSPAGAGGAARAGRLCPARAAGPERPQRPERGVRPWPCPSGPGPVMTLEELPGERRAAGRDPDNVVLCLLAAEEEEAGDAALQIHFTLLRAFCCENDINILRVSNPARLAELLLPAAGPDPPADLHCVLVTVSPGCHRGGHPRPLRIAPNRRARDSNPRAQGLRAGGPAVSPGDSGCLRPSFAVFSPSSSFVSRLFLLFYLFFPLFSSFPPSLFIFPPLPLYFSPFLSPFPPVFLSLPPAFISPSHFFPVPTLPQSPKLNSSHAPRPDLFVCLASNLR